MKFTTQALVAVSGLCYYANALPSISNYEILPAGDGSSTTPSGKVITVTPFNAEVYFEKSPSVNVTMELFYNVPDGAACDTGTLLPSSDYNATETTFSASGYTKVTSNGIFGAAVYTIADVTTTAAYNDLGGSKGTLKLCARSSVKAEYDSSSNGADYISYVDTFLDLGVDLEAAFSGFTQNVSISATGVNQLSQNVTKSIEVDSFLCASGANASSSYKIGQDFSLCVRPRDDTAGYTVSNFTNVTCSNSATQRRLFVNSVPDALTSKVANATDYLSTTGEKAGAAALAFSSVVTAGFFGNGEDSFSCSGEVSLSISSKNETPVPPPPTCKDYMFVLGGPHGNNLNGLPACLKLEEGKTQSGATLLTKNTGSWSYKVVTGGLTQGGKIYSDVSDTKVAYQKNASSPVCGPNDIYVQPNMNYSSIDYIETHQVYIEIPNIKKVQRCYLFPSDTTPYIGMHSWLNVQIAEKSVVNQSDVYFDKSFSGAHDMIWYCNPVFESTYCMDSPPLRRLNSASFPHGFEAGSHLRNLQELDSDGQETEGGFVVTVGISDDRLDGLTAQAMILHGGWTAMLSVGTGLVAVLLTAFN